jgi:hypothetical protein
MEPIGIILSILLIVILAWSLSHTKADPDDPRW